MIIQENILRICKTTSMSSNFLTGAIGEVAVSICEEYCKKKNFRLHSKCKRL